MLVNPGPNFTFQQETVGLVIAKDVTEAQRIAQLWKRNSLPEMRTLAAVQLAPTASEKRKSRLKPIPKLHLTTSEIGSRKLEDTVLDSVPSSLEGHILITVQLFTQDIFSFLVPLRYSTKEKNIELIDVSI